MILYVYVYILPRTMVTNKGCANQVLNGVPKSWKPLIMGIISVAAYILFAAGGRNSPNNQQGGPHESTEVCLQHPLSRLFLLHHRVWCWHGVKSRVLLMKSPLVLVKLSQFLYLVTGIILVNSPIVTMLPLHIWVPHDFCTLRQGQWKRTWLPGQELPVQPGPDKVFLGAHDVFSSYKNYGFEQTMNSGNFKKKVIQAIRMEHYAPKKKILLFYETCDLSNRSGGLQCKVA